MVQIGTGAAGTAVGALSRVQSFVELEVNKLCEAGWTQFALVRPLTRVQPLVGLEIACTTEAFMTYLCLKKTIQQNS